MNDIEWRVVVACHDPLTIDVYGGEDFVRFSARSKDYKHETRARTAIVRAFVATAVMTPASSLRRWAGLSSTEPIDRPLAARIEGSARRGLMHKIRGMMMEANELDGAEGMYATLINCAVIDEEPPKERNELDTLLECLGDSRIPSRVQKTMAAVHADERELPEGAIQRLRKAGRNPPRAAAKQIIEDLCCEVGEIRRAIKYVFSTGVDWRPCALPGRDFKLGTVGDRRFESIANAVDVETANDRARIAVVRAIVARIDTMRKGQLKMLTGSSDPSDLSDRPTDRATIQRFKAGMKEAMLALVEQHGVDGLLIEPS